MQTLLRKGLSGLALLAVALVYVMGQQADGTEQGDYYLLALSWAPSWCDAEGDARGAPQCADGTGWQVHGLWPQHDGGGWPEYCDTQARDPSRARTRAMSDIMGEGGLAWHQWKKHGRCSGLSADAYFKKTRAAYDGLDWPETLTRVTGQTRATPDAVEDAFRAANPAYSENMVITTCRDGDLREIRLCLTHDLHPRPCEADVLERACRARQINVPPAD